MESIKSDANVANVQCFYPLEANIETTGQCCILLGSEFYFRFRSNYYSVGSGLCRLELRLQRNSVVFVFWWNILCGCAHKSIVQLCSFLTSWAASIFRVSQRIKMCAGRVGDFQAIGYLGSFSLNFSLRSALLLEEKERCEEVTEEMEQVHRCAWKEARSRGRRLSDIHHLDIHHLRHSSPPYWIQTFITLDFHHPLPKIRHSSPRRSSPQTFITHNCRIRRSSPRTFIT